jgi:hypothetical protein
MDRLFRRISCIAIMVAMLLPFLGIAGSNAARADSMTWQLRSFYPIAVEVKFFSQNRKAVWPTATTHYDIKDNKTHSFKLNCLEGEQVCYGAGASGNLKRYWGKSTDGTKACADCCYTCKGNTTTKVLNLNEQ